MRLSRLDDRPTPREVHNWRLYAMAALVVWAGILTGYESSYINAVISMRGFRLEFGLDRQSPLQFLKLQTDFVWIFQGAAFFGAWPTGYFVSHYLGRKWGLFFASAVCLIGIILHLSASRNTGIALVYAGHVLSGYSVGMCAVLAPLYLAEIAPSGMRGRFVGSYVVGSRIGSVIAYWSGYGVSRNYSKGDKSFILFALQLLPAGMLAISSLFLKESPRWLIAKGRDKRALANLAFLRNLPRDHAYVQEEMAEMTTQTEEHIDEAGRGVLGPITTMVTSRTYMYRLAVCMGLFLCQAIQGCAPTSAWAPLIVMSMRYSATEITILSGGIFGLIMLVAVTVWLLFLVDRVGRKWTLIVGSVGCVCTMLWIGVFTAVSLKRVGEGVSMRPNQKGIAGLVGMYLFSAAYALSWSGTPWVIGAESMPTYISSATQSCLAASYWLFIFLFNLAANPMIDKMQYGTYLFWALVTLIFIIPALYFILPETAGIPIERMDELYSLSPRKAHRTVMHGLREGYGDRGTGSPDGQKDSEDLAQAPYKHSSL